MMNVSIKLIANIPILAVRQIFKGYEILGRLGEANAEDVKGDMATLAKLSKFAIIQMCEEEGIQLEVTEKDVDSMCKAIDLLNGYYDSIRDQLPSRHNESYDAELHHHTVDLHHRLATWRPKVK